MVSLGYYDSKFLISDLIFDSYISFIVSFNWMMGIILWGICIYDWYKISDVLLLSLSISASYLDAPTTLLSDLLCLIIISKYLEFSY